MNTSNTQPSNTSNSTLFELTVNVEIPHDVADVILDDLLTLLKTYNLQQADVNTNWAYI